MRLERLSCEALRTAYQDLLLTAFPPEELKPLAVMEAMMQRGDYEALGIFQQENCVGVVLLWWSGEQFCLIDYLAVSAECRNGGLGAWCLQALQERYPNCLAFIGESEAPVAETEAENTLIRRRLAFYERNGAEILSYRTALFGVSYETVCWRKAGVTDEAVLIQHRNLYQKQFSEEQYRKAIQIPLLEKPFARTAWQEGEKT